MRNIGGLPRNNSLCSARTGSSALTARRTFYRLMNSTETVSPTADLHAESNAEELGTNVGAIIVEKMDLSPQGREAPGMRRSLGCNVGPTEQKFRIGAGTALLAAAA